jgi:hypothetical protein
MNHPYLTSNGAPSAREITLHYVTTCLQLEQIDILLGKMVSGIQKVTGQNIELNILNATLDANDKGWERRAKLAAQRSPSLTTTCQPSRRSSGSLSNPPPNNS